MALRVLHVNMRMSHTGEHASVSSARRSPARHTASTCVHALTRFNYSRPFSPQRTIVLHNVCVLLGWETQLKRWWKPLHPFSSEDLEPSGCSEFTFTIPMSELSLLILHFFVFLTFRSKLCEENPVFFFFFFASAHLKMQTRCWDEKIFVSFHLLLTAFLEDVWKQTRLLLPRLENFKSPSEKTGQKPRSVLCCGEWASFSVAMKPSAMLTFTLSSFGYRKE